MLCGFLEFHGTGQQPPDSEGYFHTSKLINNTKNTYEINRRVVYGMRSVGQFKKCCGIMNMPALSQGRPMICNKQILRATKQAAIESMKQATKEEIYRRDRNRS